jgi:N-acetylglucosaminyldiphosphoundecaprenol N-acetyl-beta-D-mannosaminyltransferase
MECTTMDRTHNILNIEFDLVDYPAVMEMIDLWRRNGERRYLTLTPPHSVMMCESDAELRRATNQASLTLPDGIGIILAANILSYPHHGRVTGPTLMLKLCDWGRATGYGHFFYGGFPGVADVLARRLIDQFPGLKVTGAYSPPFRKLTGREDVKIIHHINSTKPDIVWVGLGSPRQEKWMVDHVGKIDATGLIGVGAAFDFHSGRVKWAPSCVRKVGMEWAFRLVTDPKHMWRRNVNSVVFLSKVLRQSLGTSRVITWLRHAANPQDTP